MRLTRKQVKEALEQTPIEQVLLGSVGARETKLTPKQREFARQLAMGESKAGAYRKSRESKAKPSTASRKGVALASQDHIRAQVEAFKAAFEAQKYQTPAHLRALAIHELTKHALNEDCPPAQRIKALELIGKMTEVALFTERREIVQVTDAAQAKERLLDALRTITQAEVVDVVDTAAESLLAELAGPEAQPEEIEALADDPQADHPETILNSPPGATPHPPAA
jgi:hypothetical protein